MFRNSFLKNAGAALAIAYIHLSLVAVNQIAPNGAVTDPVPVFSWQEDSAANWYLLWISNADNTQTVYQQWIHNDSLTTLDGVCSYAPDAPFAEGESYSWWVQPRSEEGIDDWSDGLTFDIVSEFDITPTIKGVFTDPACEHLLIDGVNFGEHPKVYLDQFPLTLSQCGAEYLIADLPEGLSPGNFKLKVIRMPETSVEGEVLTDLKSDEMDFTIGAMGPTGPQGPRGETGPRGAKGDTGPRGAQGDKGATGAQGPRGKQGEVGPQGIQGLLGLQGIQGETGPQGDKGDAGDPGLAWQGTWAIGTPYTINDAVVYNGSAYISISESNTGNTPDASPTQWALFARKGDTGDQGLQGIQGIQGAKGDKGDKGDTGDPGDKGDKGDTGDTGPAGADGEDGADGQDANFSAIKLGFVRGHTTIPGNATDYIVRMNLTDMTDYPDLDPNDVNIIAIVEAFATWTDGGEGEVIHGWGTSSNKACITMTNPSSSEKWVFPRAYFLYYDK